MSTRSRLNTTLPLNNMIVTNHITIKKQTKKQTQDSLKDHTTRIEILQMKSHNTSLHLQITTRI